MKRALKIVIRLSTWSNVIAGGALTFMMFLTVCDVILRCFNRPIVGTYELVAFLGAVVIGFSAPLTAWMRGHVSVDILTARFSRKVKNIFDIGTRCLVIGLFFVIGWRLMKYGTALHRAREVSMTLEIPFYPVAYGLGICCFVHCLVSLCDILKISEGSYE